MKLFLFNSLLWWFYRVLAWLTLWWDIDLSTAGDSSTFTSHCSLATQHNILFLRCFLWKMYTEICMNLKKNFKYQKRPWCFDKGEAWKAGERARFPKKWWKLWYWGTENHTFLVTLNEKCYLSLCIDVIVALLVGLVDKFSLVIIKYPLPTVHPALLNQYCL